MAVQRCPSCGRAWDGALCFACGHEAGAALKTAPAPAPAAAAPPPPPAAPAPAPAPPPPAPAPPRAPQAAAPTTPPTAKSPFAPPLQPKADSGGVPKAKPAPTVPTSPPVAPPLPNDPFAAQPTLQLTRPTPAAPAPTKTSPLEALPPPLLKLWNSPGAFAAVFVLGFFLAFGIGAIALWRGTDIETLLSTGQADAALAALDAKKQLSPQELLWKGHALYQKGNREGMLRAYQAAVMAKSVDERALVNTLDALGTDKVASLAVKTLEDWPGDDVNDRLLVLTTDATARRRHSALETLTQRSSASPNQRLAGAIKVAVTDLRSDVCEQKAAGLTAIATFVEKPEAAPVLKAAGAWKALYEQDSDVVFAKHRCLDAALVKRTLAAASVIER